MWHEVAKLDDIAPGGMKYVRAGEATVRSACVSTTAPSTR